MKDAADQTLIDACLAGRRDAFGLLVERYQHRLYCALVPVTGSADRACDVTQEAFLHAFEKLGTFRGQSAFYSWLFRIAMNAALTDRRRSRTRAAASIEATREQTGLEPADEHPDSLPAAVIDHAERARLVHQALADLPEEYRVVLVLKEFDDLKYEEIAVALGIPVGTVRSRIHRGRLELRQRLGPLLEAED